ncbi:MAG: hypothetical protein AB9842_08085 [Bacteroidales bacterium]
MAGILLSDREIQSTEFIDEKNGETIITNYDPQSDTSYTLYIGERMSKRLPVKGRFFYNIEPMDDIEEGSLFKLVDDELILVDDDRYYSLKALDGLGKFREATCMGSNSEDLLKLIHKNL